MKKPEKRATTHAKRELRREEVPMLRYMHIASIAFFALTSVGSTGCIIHRRESPREVRHEERREDKREDRREDKREEKHEEHHEDHR